MGCCMAKQSIVIEYVSSHTYDIRETRNGRWIDQKCAFDAVCFVADCVVEYLSSGGSEPFHSPEIWHSEYAMEQVREVFVKPDPTRDTTTDEYNKFFRQPLKMLSAAGVLNEHKRGNIIDFWVADMEMLDYIASREANSLEFLCEYIEKTLRDSGLWWRFESFFDSQTQSSLTDLKEEFAQFCYTYTPIKNKAETGRIFSKVLNPLAFRRHLRGVERGRLSKHVVTKDKLVYNRTNWRDDLAGKEKNVSRGDYVPPEGVDTSFEHRVAKAMGFVKKFNDRWRNGKSEVLDWNAANLPGNVVHHIFPKSQFKDLADYYENLVVLTSAQHMGSAHPAGNTSVIDPSYQKKCLISKIEVIRGNVEGQIGESVVYSYDRLVEVLRVGLETDYFDSLPEGNFGALISALDLFYD